MTNYTPYTHQQETMDKLAVEPRFFDASDMGVGKTFCQIMDVDRMLAQQPMQKVLILAPKSLLYSVWYNDFQKFAPHIMVSVATAPAKKREEAFAKHAQVYVTNIDALKWLSEKPAKFWKEYSTVIIDESSAIKNNSARTKAALKIRKYFTHRRCMSGTLTAGPLTDMFYQYMFLDDGHHLGTKFGQFQNQCMYFIQTGAQPNHGKWHNKKGKEEVLAYMLRDITIRHNLTEVIDMPPQVLIRHKFKPNKKIMTAYNDMKSRAAVQLASGQVNAVNAASLTTKLLQIASGAVYDSEGKPHIVDTQRYDLTLDLVMENKHSVVFYNWTSQKEYMMNIASIRGLNACFIDGSVPVEKRGKLVEDFQAGNYDVIFLQLKAASHGITLTKAFTTIWAGPSYLADHYQQANARVFRIGQKQRCVTINIEAEGTLDAKVYKVLNDKLTSMDLLSEALSDEEN